MAPRRKPASPEQAVERQTAKTDTVRIEADLAEMATIVAIRKKIAVSDLISPHLRPFLEAEYASTVKAMNSEIRRPK
jgi:hypothetical protein